MDKSTLSNYGWVVIAVLVLSVMIALATPFGKFVGDAVNNTLQGLIEVSDKGMSAAIDKAGNVENDDDIIGDDDIAGEDGSGDMSGDENQTGNKAPTPVIKSHEGNNITLVSDGLGSVFNYYIVDDSFNGDVSGLTPAYTVDAYNVILTDFLAEGGTYNIAIVTTADGYDNSDALLVKNVAVLPQLNAPNVSLSNDSNPYEVTVTGVDGADYYTIELNMNGYDRDPVFYTSTTAPFTVDLRDVIANANDSRLYGMSLKLRFAAYADGYLSNGKSLSGVKITQLATPTLSLDYFTLTIDEVNGATAYEIYIDGALKGTTTNLTVDLWNTYGSVSDGTHTVKVIAIDNVNNAYADSVAATIEWSVSEDSGIIESEGDNNQSGFDGGGF